MNAHRTATPILCTLTMLAGLSLPLYVLAGDVLAM